MEPLSRVASCAATDRLTISSWRRVSEEARHHPWQLVPYGQLQNAYLTVAIGFRGTDRILIPAMPRRRKQSNQPRPEDLQQTTKPENIPVTPQFHIDCTHLKQLDDLCETYQLKMAGSDLIRLGCKTCNEHEICPSMLMDEITGLCSADLKLSHEKSV